MTLDSLEPTSPRWTAFPIRPCSGCEAEMRWHPWAGWKHTATNSEFCDPENPDPKLVAFWDPPKRRQMSDSEIREHEQLFGTYEQQRADEDAFAQQQRSVHGGAI